MSQEAKHALTVVGSHADHAILGQCSAVISRLTATASHESTAIEIYQYRQTFLNILGWSPHVQVETVLTARRSAEIHVAKEIWLHRVIAKVLCLAHALPCLQWLRSLPAQLSYRRSSKRNAKELLHAVSIKAFDHTCLSLDLKGQLGLLLTTRLHCNNRHCSQNHSA